MLDLDLLQYGTLQKIDLHGLTKEEANFELLTNFNRVDCNVSGFVVVHGYHSGQTLRNLVRNEFFHPLLKEKIKIDPSRTLFLIDWTNYSTKN